MKPRIRKAPWLSSEQRWMCTDEGRIVGWGATPFYAYCEWEGTKRAQGAEWEKYKAKALASGGTLLRYPDGQEAVVTYSQ